ncbi:MAG: hypothetical protein LUD77_04350 [Clostridiales bacterium]|nr:hypothetical protein [Clostridiales bacterium]
MNKSTAYTYINKNGKKVAGTAAHLHRVYTEMGGVDKYNKMVNSEHIKELAFRGLDIACIIIKSVMKVKRF